MKKKLHKSTVLPSGDVKSNTKSTNNSANQYFTPHYTAAAIALITLAVYLPALQNSFVAGWDDALYVIDNVHIRSLRWEFFRWAIFDSSVAMYWHPLTWISHALDYAFWGLNPLGHHLTSIMLHALNSAIAVYLTIILLNIINEEQKKAAGNAVFDRRSLLIAGGFTGLLFGIHPLHVESVAWISMRKELLYALFYMLSIMSYIRYASKLGYSGVQRPFYRNGRYYASLTLFSLSLCSKPMAVTLPAILLLLDWYPLKRTVSRKAICTLVYEKLPYFALSCGVSAVTALAQNTGGFLRPLEEVSFPTRLLVVFRTLVMYLWNTVAPVNLLPGYPFPKDVSISKPEYLLAVLLVSLITSACIFIAKKQPVWLTVWGSLVVMLIPATAFFRVALAMADRYMYLPSFGLFLLLGLGVAKLWAKAGTLHNKGKIIQGFVTAAVILLTTSLTLLSIKQIRIWKNTIILCNYFIENAPIRFREGYFWRGEAFGHEGQYDRAIEDYNTAISIDPKYGAAYFNRGSMFLVKGDYDRALEDFDMTIVLEPDAADAYTDRGNVFYKMGKIDRAIEEYNTAISKKPTFCPAFINRGIAFRDRGETNKALADFSKALDLNSDELINVTTIYLVRGDLYMKNGTIDLAMRDYQKACELGSEMGCKKQSFPFATPQVRQSP